MLTYQEITRRALSGPIMSEKDYDLKRFVRTLRRIVKKYDIQNKPDQPVPWDDDLADRFFQAGLDTAVEAGMLCTDTQRRIMFSREEIMAALDAGAREIILGIGGSATVDGGCGFAQAVGAIFMNESGEAVVCGMGGGALGGVSDIDLSDVDERLAQADIRVACDVTNPLLGEDGAAAVFGPQKGATPEMIEQLEAGLANLARIIGL